VETILRATHLLTIKHVEITESVNYIIVFKQRTSVNNGSEFKHRKNLVASTILHQSSKTQIFAADIGTYLRSVAYDRNRIFIVVVVVF